MAILNDSNTPELKSIESLRSLTVQPSDNDTFVVMDDVSGVHMMYNYEPTSTLNENVPFVVTPSNYAGRFIAISGVSENDPIYIAPEKRVRMW